MFFAPGRRKKIIGWVLYDFANTSFSVIVVTVVYAIYYKQYICAEASLQLFGKTFLIGDFLWGISGSLSMLLVAISSPYFGILADISPYKKRMIFIYTILTIVSTTLLFFLQPGMFLLGSILFIVGNFGFEGAIVFYNSYLPGIVEKQYWGRLSGLGFGVGYVGSLFSLLIVLPIANLSTAQNSLGVMKYSFPLAAGFFLIFSIPFFLWVKTNPIHEENQRTSFRELRLQAYRNLIRTLKEIKKYPEIVTFLISFFVYIDAVNTVIYFGGIYSRDTLQFSMKEVLIFFAIIQSTAIVGSFIFGSINDRIGPKKTLYILLTLWIVVVLLGAASQNKNSFYIVGLMAGLGTGSIQTTSRVFMASLIPPGRESEFFGFYALTGKFSAILGPTLFGLISSITHNQRLAVLSLVIFFIAGGIILRKVRLNKL